MWLQIYRGLCNSSGEHFDAYEAVSREILHWMGVPRMDFDNAAAEQMRQKNLSDKDFRALKASLHETNDEGKVAPSLSAKGVPLIFDDKDKRYSA